jgi:hypothetical protein
MLEFAVACEYLDRERARELFKTYDEIIGMLVTMIGKPHQRVMPTGRKASK